jgi:DNA-directed RNA polymerase subunit RPC12/RpoP
MAADETGKITMSPADGDVTDDEAADALAAARGRQDALAYLQDSLDLSPYALRIFGTGVRGLAEIAAPGLPGFSPLEIILGLLRLMERDAERRNQLEDAQPAALPAVTTGGPDSGPGRPIQFLPADGRCTTPGCPLDGHSRTYAVAMRCANCEAAVTAELTFGHEVPSPPDAPPCPRCGCRRLVWQSRAEPARSRRPPWSPPGTLPVSR